MGIPEKRQFRLLIYRRIILAGTLGVTLLFSVLNTKVHPALDLSLPTHVNPHVSVVEENAGPHAGSGFRPSFLSDFNLKEKVDTSKWSTYKNLDYGYEFRYPTGWRISIPAGYVANDGLQIVNPTELRPLEDSGTVPYWIYVGRAPIADSQPDSAGIQELTRAIEVSQPETTFAALGCNEGILAYGANSESNWIQAYIMRHHRAYRIDLNQGFYGRPSTADFETFLGICSTFQIL